MGIFRSQKSSVNIFPAEESETGVRGSALPRALRRYESSLSIFLGSRDFGPFLGSPLRGIVDLRVQPPCVLGVRQCQDVPAGLQYGDVASI